MSLDGTAVEIEISVMFSIVSAASPPADPGRRALTRLLERIRRQRDQRTRQQIADTPVTSHDGDAEEQALSVETGSLSSQEKASGGSSEEQTPSTTHTEEGKHSTFTIILLLGTLKMISSLILFLSS